MAKPLTVQATIHLVCSDVGAAIAASFDGRSVVHGTVLIEGVSGSDRRANGFREAIPFTGWYLDQVLPVTLKKVRF